MNTLFNSRKCFFATFLLVAVIALGPKVSAQSYQIIGTKAYSLKEGDSVKVVIKNLQKIYQNVFFKIVNPDPNHLHIPSDGRGLPSLSLSPSGGVDSAFLYCTYYPKAEHPITAIIYVSDYKDLQHDTITFTSTDTSNGLPDPFRIKDYLHFYTSDTTMLYTSKENPAWNAVSLMFTRKTNDIIDGYAMLQNRSGKFILDSHPFFFDKFTSGPLSFNIYYTDKVGYGNRDTAMIIFSFLTPRDAKPDTIMIYEVDDDAALEIDAPDFYNVPRAIKTCRPFKIINRNDSALTISSFLAHYDTTHFLFEPALSFPMTVGAHSELDLTICYSAPDSVKSFSDVSGYVYIDPFSHRVKHATGVFSFRATTDNECVAASRDTVRFADNFGGKAINDSVKITNGTKDSLLFSNVIWKYLNTPDNNHFTAPGTTFPFKIAPGESKEIYLTFSALQGESGQFTGLAELNFQRIDYDDSTRDTLCILRWIQVVGNAIKSSVETVSSLSPTITIIPNPAREQVMIRALGIRPALFEIYNALGGRIAEKKNVTEWLWNPALERVADGIYFVRVSGESNDGRSFVTTKKIIIEN